MRTALALLAAAGLVTTLAAPEAMAQSRGRDSDKSTKAPPKKKKDESWNAPQAALPGERNVGPCPFVKVLYDAHRYVEFDGGREASAAVGYTGEIQGVSADCSYRGEEPIAVDMNVGFTLGRGPMAKGTQKTYGYWIAVTQRNKGVLAKEFFTLPATFAAGQDRMVVNERVSGIVIPRASATTSGSNFEILVGFDVTPQMAEFNREGKRFRVNAAPVQAAATAPPPQTASR